MSQKVKIVVQSYDESDDTFTIAAFGFEPEHEAADPDYCRDAPDFDDFTIPGILLPALIDRYGEPAELVGIIHEMLLPA